jgi:Ribonuclease G/E
VPGSGRSATAGSTVFGSTARTIRIFEEYGIQLEIEKSLRSKVWLKSGGYIVINQTEALVAIDFNTGKYVGKKRPEDTVVRTNLEGRHLIVRANPSVARVFRKDEYRLVQDLEEILGSTITIKSDDNLHHEQFDVMAV